MQPRAGSDGDGPQMTHDHSIREPGRLVLTLRGDLVFSPRTSGQDTYYLVEDPFNSKFYRLGVAEYGFVSLLDGKTSISQAMRLLSTAMPDHGITDHDSVAICQWLIDSDLAHTRESGSADRLARSASDAGRREVAARLNPLVHKLALGNPDRVLDAVRPWIGWLHSPFAIGLWLVLVFLALLQVSQRWEQFAAASQGIFAPSNWIWLAACWLGLKIVHESAHGLVCRRYGGVVREYGVLFILFAPLAYVDVTSSWRFRSKWQRIHTAAAGMYIEILVAAIAGLVWCHVSAESQLSHVCYNLVIMASLTTILFNANPLMKFDGYYILSDLVGITNLYANGQQYVQYWCRKFLMSLPATLPAWSGRTRTIIGCYGVASLCWRVLICVCLVVTASTLFHGAGIVLAVAAMVMWIGVPAVRFVRFLFCGKPGEQPNKLRFLSIAGSGALIAVMLLGVVPWPGASQAPAIVEFSQHSVVRADSPGFIEQIPVQSGDHVEAGDILAVLHNDVLKKEFAEIEIAIEKSELQSRALENQGKLAAQQSEDKRREALGKQLAEKRDEVERLTIRAPHGGTILGRNLDNLIGTYAEKGFELLSIGSDNGKEIRVSISQNDVDAFSNRIGSDVKVHLMHAGKLSCELSKINPRASHEPTHPALCAINDGPLPVKNSVSQSDDETSKENPYELLAPRFEGVVKLTDEQSQSIHAGECCTISFRPCHRPIGVHLYVEFSRWVREKVRVHTS